ncbi:hypothetical protein Hgul01_04834 [Herpetosiphon gulosus]|uniref:Uncharacterized protein n=1 Tax=Herpetosiphon gulosus TaxID=1973496 RepID=A0ABP9X8Y9_9CHLR
MLITGLFGGCVLGAGVATIMQYLVPLERVLWFRHASFWLLRAATVALVVLVGIRLLG